MITIKHLLLLLFISLHSLSAYNHEEYLLNTLFTHVPVANSYKQTLWSLCSHDQEQEPIIDQAMPDRALYRAYPQLVATLPHQNLGDLPTPIKRLDSMSDEFGFDLYIKCDDLTGALLPDGSRWYGGNKIRKLEFLYADGLLHGAECFLTFGCVGSNHATANAACAHLMGVKSISMLKPQPNSHVVRKNLMLMHSFDSDMRFFANIQTRAQGAVATCRQYKVEQGTFPYVIPTGGSCPLGAVGFVNAAFELKEQIERNQMPMPDYIYVAAGTKGTIAGLMLGIELAQLPIHVVPICVQVEDCVQFPKSVKELIRATNELLHAMDSSIQLVDVDAMNLPIVYDCCGQSYGLFSHEAVAAMKLMKDTENIVLEGTYTGKVCAELVRDAAQLKGKKVLFWNTYCGDSFEKQLYGRSYRTLPQALHRFFQEDVQELDRK